MNHKLRMSGCLGILIVIIISLTEIGCSTAPPTGPTEEPTEIFIEEFRTAAAFFLNFGLALNGIAYKEFKIGFPGLEVLEEKTPPPGSSHLKQTGYLEWQGPIKLPASIPDPLYYCKEYKNCREGWYFIELPAVSRLENGKLTTYLITTPSGKPDAHPNPASVVRLDEVTMLTGDTPNGKLEIKWDYYMETNATDSNTYDGAYRVTALVVDGTPNNSYIEFGFVNLTVGDGFVSGAITKNINFALVLNAFTINLGINGRSIFDNFGEGGKGKGYLYHGTNPGENGNWATKTENLIPFTEGILMKFQIKSPGEIQDGKYIVEYEAYSNRDEVKIYPPE